MRVAQLKTTANRGGAETLLLELTQELAGRGHEFYTFVADEGWLVEKLKAAGLKTHTFSLRPFRLPLSVRRIYKIISKGNFDVILSHGARVNLISSLVSFLTGVPLITVEHGIDDWRNRRGLRVCADRFIGRISTRRVAVSSAVRAMLDNEKIVKAEKIIVINNRTKVPERPDSADELKRNFFLSERLEEPILSIVAVARLAEVKGHANLLKAMPEVLSNIPSIRLYLIGEGELKANLSSLARDLGIEKSLVFLGERDNVPELLPIFDIFVLPSVMEGLPLALLEAMGMGLPIIATAVGGIPEIITNTVNGLLVPSGDHVALSAAIIELIQNPVQRKQLGEAAYQYAHDKLDFCGMVDSYENLLLIEARRAKRPTTGS